MNKEKSVELKELTSELELLYPNYIIAGLKVRVKLETEYTKQEFSEVVDNFLNSSTFVEVK
jgi:hypothetical protein